VKLLCAIIVAVALWFGYRHWTKPIVHPPGVLVESSPRQVEITSAQRRSSMARFG
jgi:hypothetical protein